jgi:hypothetical protein
MTKGQKTTREQLKKEGWFKEDGLMDGCEIWVHNILVAYLYFDPKESIVRDSISV